MNVVWFHFKKKSAKSASDRARLSSYFLPFIIIAAFALGSASHWPVDDVAELAIAGGTAQQVRRGPLRHHHKGICFTPLSLACGRDDIERDGTIKNLEEKPAHKYLFLSVSLFSLSFSTDVRDFSFSGWFQRILSTSPPSMF